MRIDLDKHTTIEQALDYLSCDFRELVRSLLVESRSVDEINDFLASNFFLSLENEYDDSIDLESLEEMLLAELDQD